MMHSTIEIRNILLAKGIEVWNTQDNRGIVLKTGNFLNKEVIFIKHGNQR